MICAYAKKGKSMIGRRVQLLGYALAGGCFFFLLTSMVNWERPRQESPRPLKNVRRQFRPLAPPLDIQGFRFSCRVAGKENISIAADRFTIRKKKIGFLRIGLMNEAVLFNGSIKIYGDKSMHVPGPADGDVEHEDKVISGPRNSSREPVFAEVLSPEMLPSFAMPRVTAISVEPVHISLYDDQEVATSISAKSAAIRLMSRDILFRGAVRVSSGDRVLTTGLLNLIPGKAILAATGPFNLRTSTGSQHGRRLVTDVFLRPVAVDNT
jgi:hypothetical protein